MKGTGSVEGSKFLDQSGSIPDAGTLTVGSLFSGIGGFELGFEATGRFETRWQVECDAYATKVLQKHWPDVQRHDDVCTWPNETTQPVDVIIGGFPCQDISYAGKGAGLDGERSGLFYELMRIVRVVGPKYVVLENVAALFTRGMDQVLGTLASHGYDAEWEVVSAASVGAPHRRDRVFIIGTICNSNSESKPQGQTASRTEDGYICLSCGSEIFSGCGCDHGEWVCNRCGEYTYPFHYDIKEDGCVHCGSNDVSYAFSERGCSRDSKRQDAKDAWQSPRRTEHWGWHSEPAVGRVANGIPRRVDRLKCLGNAIVPQVAQVVAERLLEIHDQNN